MRRHDRDPTLAGRRRRRRHLPGPVLRLAGLLIACPTVPAAGIQTAIAATTPRSRAFDRFVIARRGWAIARPRRLAYELAGDAHAPASR